MHNQALIAMLSDAKEYFDRSTACLEEGDSGFVPSDGLYSVAQQVAHVAHTVDWFLEGAFRPEGFDTDWEPMIKLVREVQSLAAARKWLDRSFEQAIETLGGKSEAEMAEILEDQEIMPGKPRWAIVGAIQEHTAHHRGALTVYARLCGREPAMPYMEM